MIPLLVAAVGLGIIIGNTVKKDDKKVNTTLIVGIAFLIMGVFGAFYLIMNSKNNYNFNFREKNNISL